MLHLHENPPHVFNIPLHIFISYVFLGFSGNALHTSAAEYTVHTVFTFGTSTILLYLKLQELCLPFIKSLRYLSPLPYISLLPYLLYKSSYLPLSKSLGTDHLISRGRGWHFSSRQVIFFSLFTKEVIFFKSKLQQVFLFF